MGCRELESEFAHIALLNIKDKKEYEMTTDNYDLFNNICTNIKNGAIINLTYALEQNYDESNGEHYDTYVIYSYKR